MEMFYGSREQLNLKEQLKLSKDYILKNSNYLVGIIDIRYSIGMVNVRLKCLHTHSTSNEQNLIKIIEIQNSSCS
jgi:hypothetical protein